MSIASIPHLLSTEVVTYVSSTQTNLNLQTLFGSSIYSAGVNKKVIINSGVTVGATNTSNYALNIPSGFKGRIVVVNNGSIQGAGGAANGGTGGNAIFAGDTNIFIDNRGTIYSGGGGGGQGGTGGQGYYGSSYEEWSNGNDVCSSLGYGPEGCDFDGACVSTYGANNYCYYLYNLCSGTGGCANDPPNGTTCGTCRRIVYYNVYTSGGAGGSGGVGQGYNQSASAGSAGSAGGINAGTGGTGGTGGSFGSSGNSGGTGSNGNYTAGSAGSSGGLAGFYVVNNSNVTWISNGTRAGRVG